MALVSFRHNFIFVKTQKTAGSSVEVDLGACLEPEAIVTPVYPVPLTHVARNFSTEMGVFYNHMSAGEIRKILGQERFEGMFKFCIEREPVSKCISHFHMLRNSPYHNPAGEYALSWDEYVSEGNFPFDVDKYSEVQNGDRKILVDRILSYEALAKELPSLLESLGIINFKLQATEKSEYSKRVLVGRAQVTEAQRDRIYSAFAETLEIMKHFGLSDENSAGYKL